jgi:hypothetical protein
MVVVASGCGAPAPRPVAPVEAPRVRVELGELACPPAADAQARMERVLRARGAERAPFAIRVEAQPIDDKTRVHLTVVRASGDVGLDRAYELNAADCASGGDLLALALDRFLEAFPEWIGPPRPSVPAPPPERWLEVAAIGAVNSIYRPLGVDGQAGAVVDVGNARHRFGGSLVVRGSVPQAAGDGRFQQTSVLAGASYRHHTCVWEVRAEARAGALLVIGMGFTENAHDWLPWWEGAVFAGRALGFGTLGIELAVSGLRDKAVTRDGLVSQDIPLVRLGLALQIDLLSSTP